MAETTVTDAKARLERGCRKLDALQEELERLDAERRELVERIERGREWVEDAAEDAGVCLVCDGLDDYCSECQQAIEEVEGPGCTCGDEYGRRGCRAWVHDDE